MLQDQISSFLSSSSFCVLLCVFLFLLLLEQRMAEIVSEAISYMYTHYVNRYRYALRQHLFLLVKKRVKVTDKQIYCVFISQSYPRAELLFSQQKVKIEKSQQVSVYPVHHKMSRKKKKKQTYLVRSDLGFDSCVGTHHRRCIQPC